MSTQFDPVTSTCDSCMFWYEDHQSEHFGTCVRHAPVPASVSDRVRAHTCAEHVEILKSIVVQWPITRAGDGCGEWREQE